MRLKRKMQRPTAFLIFFWSILSTSSLVRGHNLDIQHEAIFKEQEPVIENIVSHIISFGWGVIHGNSHEVMKTLPVPNNNLV